MVYTGIYWYMWYKPVCGMNQFVWYLPVYVLFTGVFQRLMLTVGSRMDPKMAIDQLKASTNQQLKKLKQSELDMRQSTQKMKDLAVNIRLMYKTIGSVKVQLSE